MDPDPIAPASPAPKPDALADLIASRQQLRVALLGIAHPPEAPPLLSDGIGGLADHLVQRARSVPGAVAVMEGARAWWEKNPIRKAVNLADPVATPLVLSAVPKNPQASLLTGVVLGAVVLIVPWRRVLFRLARPALISGLLFEVAKAALRRAR